MKDRPENAIGFFIGDTFGGSGWEILMPDGTTEKLYVDLDLGQNIITKVFFVTSPISHLGQIVEDTSIENCCLSFYTYLENVVEKATAKFIIK